MTLTKHSRIPIYLKWSSDLDKPPAEHRGNQTAKSYSPEFEKNLPIKKTRVPPFKSMVELSLLPK